MKLKDVIDKDNSDYQGASIAHIVPILEDSSVELGLLVQLSFLSHHLLGLRFRHCLIFKDFVRLWHGFRGDRLSVVSIQHLSLSVIQLCSLLSVLSKLELRPLTLSLDVESGGILLLEGVSSFYLLVGAVALFGRYFREWQLLPGSLHWVGVELVVEAGFRGLRVLPSHGRLLVELLIVLAPNQRREVRFVSGLLVV